jgi:hypothetical protein
MPLAPNMLACSIPPLLLAASSVYIVFTELNVKNPQKMKIKPFSENN